MSHSNREQLFQWMKSFVYRYSEKPFRLASGLESHHYFNCKEITLHPERLSVLADCFVDEIIPKMQIEFDAVGGLTLSADPIAYSIALAYQKRGKLIYPLVVRKESKGHGTGQQIEGFWKGVKTCLIVDDVITTGGSTIKAVKVLREVGIKVSNGICILNREEGGKENLDAEQISMHSIFTKSEFLQ
ncbi:orotate phosphoribosyltransferase [Leptospira jelokensis]|uniref:orotate phosphoribosyltransferase n=1 Tax=Leptospira jelokensis TaxID=2484931 RepID=UPI00109100A6|nr:orotate phosphoribosyltransferase [Leptospira jelokensis]TGM05030.1 orotate phosphoribosyltransferase [Leptospira jelokensis]